MNDRTLLHVVASSRGGGAVHMHALTAALGKRGYPATATMPTDGGNVEPGDFADAGVHFVALTEPTPSLYRRIRELAAIIRSVRPRIVHAHGSRAAFWTRCALLLARPERPLFVYSVHGFATPHYPQPRRLIQSLVMRWVSAGASAVLACCRAERQALLDARSAPAARTHAIAYGIGLDEFVALDRDDRDRARAALGYAADAWVAVMVCRMDIPRDFEMLIDAFEEVADAIPAARLAIVGDGPDRERVEALIRARGLVERVTLWGFRKDVVCFFAAADVVVLTSWGWEGLPISVIEAQAAALPVVVTDAGGSGEAFEPGVTGVLIPRRDAVALRDALIRLATDPEAAARMGARGRARTLSNFELETMTTKVEELYGSLAAV